MTSTSTEAAPAGQEPRELKRVMGPWLLLLFIVGDILGAGIYAVTGQMAGYVGGVLWLPFLLAFVVAILTAFSYLELVSKYPSAAGAALYTHKAFGIHFFTFMVAFAVVCSGITSASTSAATLAQNFFAGLEPHHHLNMIGVRRSHQGLGLSRQLLVAVHELGQANPASPGTSLTTERPVNVPLYEHFGYRVQGHTRVTSALETWGMFRPRNGAATAR